MGKVRWGFTCSIDGFIAGPGHDMSWMSAAEPLAEGTMERMAGDVAVIISGRAGYDAAKAQRTSGTRRPLRPTAARGLALSSS